MKVDKIIFFITVALSVGYLSAESQSNSDRPNIIYILADDLGYGELGAYGSQQAVCMGKWKEIWKDIMGGKQPGS